MRKKTKRALTITIILIFILCAFLTAFKQYYNFINENVDSTIKNHLNQMTNQNSTIVNSHITSYFKIIESISASIQEQHDLSESEILSLIDNKHTQSIFENVGIISSNGLSTTINNKRFDASKLEFFITALKGTTNISINSFFETDNKLSCIYATPIFQKSEIVGVLFATISFDEFESILNSSLAESTVQNCIIDYNSNIIFKSGINDKNYYLSKNKTNAPFYDNLTDNGVLYKIKSDIQIKQSNVLKLNQKGTTYYICYAPIGIQDWYFTSLMKNDFVNKTSRLIATKTLIFLSIFAIILISLLVFILILFNKSKESIRKTKLELETVIANIPGGVVRFSYDDCLTIEFLNVGLLDLTGYTKYEIKNTLKNSFLNFVHQNDRQKLACAIVDQMTTNKTVEIDCRLQCNNGAYSWFLFKGRMIIDSNENCSCLCVLTDINDMKQAQQELNLSIQRYDIVTQQSDSILFEYSFIDKSIYLSEKWNNKFEYKPNKSDFRLSAIEEKLIHPDDLLVFEGIFTAIMNGQKYIEAQLRLYTLANKYIWCRIKASAIFDENGNVYKTVGKIIDIDQQKKETDLLKKKAEIDSLTGLYNKGTTKMLIDDFFNGEGKNCKHTLMILDIDNFKNINDNLGHLIGDSVITDITSKVKKLVRSSDICGRIGGDEFVILLKNTNNFDIHKANEICNAFRHTIFNGETPITISCSIGISFYDRDGTTYNELINNADIALYEAKKKGKNCFSIYSQEMQI